MTKQALGTTTVTQIAIVVADIETKVKAWADVLGLPVPEIIHTDSIDLTQSKYKGEPTSAQAKLAFFDLGQVGLELIEPIGGPSTWKDQLDQHGESLHHIAFNINGIQEKVAYLNDKGIPLIQSANYRGGSLAYMDGSDQLGAVLELLESD